MDIWLILDGEKAGPFPDYEIRGRITSGELAGGVPAWHAGLDAWRPLCEVPAFASEFKARPLPEDNPAPPPPPVPPALAPAPVPVPRPHCARRFWARWFDIQTYMALWWLGMWALGRPIEPVFTNPVFVLLQLPPWFLIEAALLHRFGTTPGKWLLGVSVKNGDGTFLSTSQGLKRGLFILLGGIGFGLPPLSWICQTVAYFTARKLGKPLWDIQGRHTVHATRLVPWRVAALAAGFLLATQLQVAVLFPFMSRKLSKDLPVFREAFEKNPPWHLPERDSTR